MLLLVGLLLLKEDTWMAGDRPTLPAMGKAPLSRTGVVPSHNKDGAHLPSLKGIVVDQDMGKVDVSTILQVWFGK